MKEAVIPTQCVYDALKRFNQAHPIKIPYNQKNPKILANDPAIILKINSQMKLKNPIFTDELLSKITFSATPLKSNTTVPVQATYSNDSVTIYVKENDSSQTQKVIDALKRFNTPASAVKIDPRYADEYWGYDRAGSAIRFYIAVQLASVLPHLKVWGITFNHVQLKKIFSLVWLLVTEENRR